MAENNEITVITINYYSARLVKRLLVNLRSRAARPERLAFVVVDNTCGQDPEWGMLENDNCRRLSGVPDVRAGRPVAPEQAQAEALNLAFSAVKTPYALAVDADVHVLRQGWDELILKELEQDVNCVAAGIELPRWRIGGARNFPAPAFCLVRSEAFRALTVNWSTEATGAGWRFWWRRMRQYAAMLGPLATRERYEESRFWRRWLERWAAAFPGGVHEEVGQRMAREIRKLHLRTLLFDHVLYTELDRRNSHPVLVELAKNFELYNYNNKPFLTHRGSGRCRRWRKERTQDTVYWLECIRCVESAES